MPKMQKQKIPKIKPGDLIEVCWDDALEMRNLVWFERDDIKPDPKDYRVRSVGYFLKLQDDQLFIYGDDGNDEIARVFIIPCGCIRKFRKLR